MNWVAIVIALLVGFALGLGIAFILKIAQAKNAKELAQELFVESETQRKANIDAVIENVRANFKGLSLDALSRSTDEFLKLAKTKLDSEREVTAKELDGKKGLIDQQLQQMTSKLEDVSKLMKDLEADRGQKFGELTTQLKTTNEQTTALM